MKTGLNQRVLSLGLACLSFGAVASAEPLVLTYEVPASRVYYNVKITVDTPGKIDTDAGQTNYEGRVAKSDDVALKFQGGLRKSAKAKGR